MTGPMVAAPSTCAQCSRPPVWDVVKGWVCRWCAVVVQERRARACEDMRAYKRQYARDYRRGIRRTEGKVPVIDRILSRLNVVPGELMVPELGACWPWLGARNADGYGVVRGDDRRLVLVHRVMLAIALGRDIPADMVARHRCDYRRCANPAHLLEGTQADNIADMVERGRLGGWAARPALQTEVPA
jgi:hypothetical protein